MQLRFCGAVFLCVGGARIAPIYADESPGISRKDAEEQRRNGLRSGKVKVFSDCTDFHRTFKSVYSAKSVRTKDNL
ncbi:hypothetical protein NIASO_12365 [Niabella soli DSM 19437]|uniref:Uncharacterized protein n=1 Tax=Niabella soli DSM 19437 TaxID=929713 RepID=W0F8C4_9BACT|nr:hypothetical protein NIASO_12365 [Niabella soli DSM 19437]